MNHKDEFERLLDIAEQALSGVDFDRREVLGFAPLSVLQEAVDNCRKKQQAESEKSQQVYATPEDLIRGGKVFYCIDCFRKLPQSL